MVSAPGSDDVEEGSELVVDADDDAIMEVIIVDDFMVELDGAELVRADVLDSALEDVMELSDKVVDGVVAVVVATLVVSVADLDLDLELVADGTVEGRAVSVPVVPSTEKRGVKLMFLGSLSSTISMV